MRKQLEIRLRELKAEYEAGQKELANLQDEEAKVRETLQKIGAAIQLLEDELSKSSTGE